MPEQQCEMSNNPDVIVTLVAQGNARRMWAHSHNEPFYIPPTSPGRNEGSREVIGSSEPALQITFSRKPKNPALGYLLGRDRNICDIFIESTVEMIRDRMFIIAVNQHNQVIMTSLTDEKISVSYGKQRQTRRKFTWIFPAEQKNICVEATEFLSFTVEVPTHDTDKATYENNCRTFLAHARFCRLDDRLKNSNQPGTGLQSGAITSQTSRQRPVYVRTVKLGAGGYGKVYKAISMPEGRTVAVKRFEDKDAWDLEVDILRKISETPHDKIVQFIDHGLLKKPYLVLGLAPGGNLAEQHKIAPFTVSETVVMLRQMLDALVFLHVDHGIIHHDVKMENILCDSRGHFRLGDFGIAKEGCYLESRKGTKPFMAPEMFLGGTYTSAVDVYALGLVIARLLTGSYPRKYIPNEGRSWCEALIAHFKRFEERTRLEGVTDLEQVHLTALVRRHMLRMKPEKRESASGCLEQGHFLWFFAENKKWILNHGTNSGSTVPQGQQNEAFIKGLPLSTESSEDGDSTEDVDTKAVTERRSLNTADWSSLEREYAINDIDTEAVTERRSLKTADWLSLEREHAVNDADKEAVSEAQSLNTAECFALELEKAFNDADKEAVSEAQSLNTAECFALELEKAFNEHDRRLAPQHGSFTDNPDEPSEHLATHPDSNGRSESGEQRPLKKRKLSP